MSSSRRTSLLASIALTLAVLVAACTPANTAPTVTIQSPTDGGSVFSPVVLAATASDGQDGDLTGAIVWVSDVDGALSPAAGGAVELSLGAHILTASATDSVGLRGSSSVSIVVVAPRSTHVVAEGLNLRLVYVEDGSLIEADSASIPATGLLPQHSIFNVIAHPSEPWLYAASMNECGDGTAACWGNGRIDRFVVENDSITHDGAAFLYDLDATAVTCAQEPVFPELVGQVGYCSPNGMVFSPDGSRFYVDDDDLDGIHIFSVDAAGDLTFLSEGATTAGHGLAIDPTGTYLYNGGSVIDVTDDVAVTDSTTNPGNATALVEFGGQPVLVSTSHTDALAVYGLLDPTAPAEITTLSLGTNMARDLDFDASFGGIVVVGRDVVQTVSFDGSILSLIDTYTASEALPTQYRGVALTDGADSAIAVWFQRLPDDSIAGGAHLFSIDGDGALLRIDAAEYDGRASTVLRVR